jgi:predicted dehydrogenase
MTPRRAAVIGCGLIGAKRAEALGSFVEAVELYDPQTDRAVTLAQTLTVPATVHPDACAALTAAGPGSLAVIATTHDGLAATAMKAVDADCHVLIEKPGARTSAELETVLEAAKRRNLTVRVGFNHRFHPSVIEANRLLHSEHLGPALLVRGRYGHGGRPGYEREWRADPEVSGGGELLDQGVHLLDLTRFLTGDIILRYGAVSTLFWDMAVEDNAFVHVGLTGGGDGWLHASWTEWKNLFALEITYRQVKLELNGLGGSYGPERLSVLRMLPQMGPPVITTTEWPPGDQSWALELEDVLGAIAGSADTAATGADASAVLQLVERIYRG